MPNPAWCGRGDDKGDEGGRGRCESRLRIVPASSLIPALQAWKKAPQVQCGSCRWCDEGGLTPCAVGLGPNLRDPAECEELWWQSLRLPCRDRGDATETVARSTRPVCMAFRNGPHVPSPSVPRRFECESSYPMVSIRLLSAV
jgi:hypothetical protein